MTEQLQIGPVALSNEEGVRRAVAQIPLVGSPDWSLHYNRRQDTMYLRRAGHGPATAYHAPRLPEVFFRLDSRGDLVGVDLNDFRRVLAREHKELRLFLRAWYVQQWMARIPGLRSVAETLSRGLRQRAQDDMQTVSAEFCLN